MHSAFFHWGREDVVLFEGWRLYTPKDTFFTCLFLVSLGILYQGIKFLRQQYGRKCKNTTCYRYMLSKGHILQTLMYLLQFTWGYSLMLSAMTYNVWLLGSVVLGFGMGYFMFGWGEYEDESSHTFPITTDHCDNECQASCSSGPRQKLLLNENGEDVRFKLKDEVDSIGCNCDDSQL